MEDQIINFYKTHTGITTCKQFNISQRQLNKILSNNSIKIHTKSESHKLAELNGDYKAPPITSGKHHYNDGIKNHTCTESEAKLNGYKDGFLPMSDETKTHKKAEFEKTNEAKYGDKNYNNRKKWKSTLVEHFGVENPSQTVEFHKEKSKKYIYEDISFDSSWELALYIYAKDHDEHIERLPVKLSYVVDDTQHYYFPDFLYNGELIEVKGDHLIEDGKLHPYGTHNCNDDVCVAKQKCMEDNNVKLLLKRDVKFALDYVKKVYGRNYLRSFKN